MRVLSLVSVASAILFASAAPATTYLISWQGGSQPKHVAYPGGSGTAGGTIDYLFQLSGSGSLTLKDNYTPGSGLDELSDFQFTTDLTLTTDTRPDPDPSHVYTTVSHQQVTFTLADLVSFEAGTGFPNNYFVPKFRTTEKSGQVLSLSSGYGVVGFPSYGVAPYGRMGFVAAPATVPELSSWGMIISGFGVMGVLMRRSRQRRVSPA